MQIIFHYCAEIRRSRRHTAGTSTLEDTTSSYHGLGRPLTVASTSGWTIRRLWKWDEKETANLAIADNSGCPEGRQFWQRDSFTPMCATLCSGDQECGPDEGRCRILDVASHESATEVLLVDALTAEDVEAAQEPTMDETPVFMLCDPFWDIEGATDADVLIGAAAAAEVE